MSTIFTSVATIPVFIVWTEFLFGSVITTRWLTVRAQAAHNIALSIYSATVTIAMLHHWASIQGPTMCAATTPLPAWLIRTWYWSKMWEWVDTAILIQRGRPVSSLHYWHHMLTPSLVALQTTSSGTHTPLYEWGVMTNAFVHTWMYAYFAYPLAWSRAWRTCITLAQIAQHTIMLIGVFTSVLRYAARGECIVDPTLNLAPLALYLFFLLEFYRLL